MKNIEEIRKELIDLFEKFLKTKTKEEDEKIIDEIIKFQGKISLEIEEMNKLVFFNKQISNIEHYNDENKILRSKLTKEHIKSFLIQLKENLNKKKL